jgi:hypothetical protein
MLPQLPHRGSVHHHLGEPFKLVNHLALSFVAVVVKATAIVKAVSTFMPEGVGRPRGRISVVVVGREPRFKSIPNLYAGWCVSSPTSLEADFPFTLVNNDHNFNNWDLETSARAHALSMRTHASMKAYSWLSFEPH